MSLDPAPANKSKLSKSSLNAHMSINIMYIIRNLNTNLFSIGGESFTKLYSLLKSKSIFTYLLLISEH